MCSRENEKTASRSMLQWAVFETTLAKYSSIQWGERLKRDVRDKKRKNRQKRRKVSFDGDFDPYSQAVASLKCCSAAFLTDFSLSRHAV